MGLRVCFLLSTCQMTFGLDPMLPCFRLSGRAGGRGWFRARLLVACAHTWDGLRRLGLWAFAGGCCLPEDPLVLVCVFFAGHGVHVGCLVDV